MNELNIAEEIIDKVFDLIESHGPEGVSVYRFKSTTEVLAAGILTGRGRVRILSGGGPEPYIVAAVKDE